MKLCSVSQLRNMAGFRSFQLFARDTETTPKNVSQSRVHTERSGKQDKAVESGLQPEGSEVQTRVGPRVGQHTAGYHGTVQTSYRSTDKPKVTTSFI